jgi:hypothetical protein
VFVEANDPEESWGSLAALVNGITVCTAHAHLVLRDPIHHPHMRRWDRPHGHEPGTEAA